MNPHYKIEAQIRALPQDIRTHLQDIFRNGLQTISGAIETNQINEAFTVIEYMSHELKRMGL